MIFPPQHIVHVLLVGWRKPGKSAQTVSKKGDRGFLRVDILEEPFPGKSGKGARESQVAEWGQSLSECMIRWLYLLAWWVQAGKCTLSTERGREIGGSFIKTIQLKSPACARSLTPPRRSPVRNGSPERVRPPSSHQEEGGVFVTRGRPDRCTHPHSPSLSTRQF